LASGDAGFIYDGQLYVIGRMANAVKVHGRWLFLEDVEVALHASGLVERSRCVVFAGAGEGGDEIVILVERDAGGDWIDGLAEHAEREVPEALGLRILAGEHGSIERTSSGKPRRGVLWAAHLEGVLPATTVHARARQRTGERTMQRTSG
jgi:acyl-CoA synthetase (AMP-forming)/AMP-acid ligase II